jgi:zinc and cadmium transporter
MHISPLFGHALLLVGLVSFVPLAAMAFMARRNTPLIWYARLVPVAAGALFSGALLHLLPEAITRLGQPLLALVLAGVGGILFWRLDHALHGAPIPFTAVQAPVPAGTLATTGDVFETPRVEDGRHRSGHALHPGIVGTAMIGDAIHNIVDGMLIATALQSGPKMGVIAALAICMHELPRELGTFAVLVRGGMTTHRALLFNVLTAALAMTGAAAVLVAGERMAIGATWLLPVAAGNFLYLALSLAKSEYNDSRLLQDGRLRLLLWSAGAAVTAVGALWHP